MLLYSLTCPCNKKVKYAYQELPHPDHTASPQSQNEERKFTLRQKYENASNHEPLLKLNKLKYNTVRKHLI
jgi:hypothetical protein